MRAVEERYGTSPRRVEYRCPRVRLGVQLLDITPPEIRPTRHTMSEPSAQLRARRNFLHPRIRFKGLLRDPSRPEPLHQDAAPVAARSPFICAFDTYHCSGTQRSHRLSPDERQDVSFPKALRHSVLARCTAQALAIAAPRANDIFAYRASTFSIADVPRPCGSQPGVAAVMLPRADAFSLRRAAEEQCAQRWS